MSGKIPKAVAGALGVAMALSFFACRSPVPQAQVTQRPQDPISLLPGTGEVKGWRRAEDPNVFVGDELYNYIDGAGEVHMSYAFRSVATCLYGSGESEVLILLDAYDMGSPENAFGLYTYFRYPGASIVAIGEEAFETGRSLEFWKGRYYIRAQAFEEFPGVQEELRRIGQAVAQKIPPELPEKWPPFPLSLLPVEGRTPRSEKLFHTKLILDNVRFLGEENLLGLGPRTDCAMADYQRSGLKMQLLIVAYQSPPPARQAMGRYVAKAGRESNEPVDGLLCLIPSSAHAGCVGNSHNLLVIAWGDPEAAASLAGEVLARFAEGEAQSRAAAP